MSETPTNQTTQRARPKLVLFDDEPKLLVRYARDFRVLGYDVYPVLVLPEDREFDKDLFAGGRLKQDFTDEEKELMADFRWQDKQVKLRSVGSALADAEKRTPTNSRYSEEGEYYRALQQIPYGVTNKEEAADLLRELKPDCVLSDYQMRQEDYVPAGSELIGDDVMALAKEICPEATRAIHTGMYRARKDALQEQKDYQKERLQVARVGASKEGHGLFAKQHLGETEAVRDIDAYFSAGQQKGREF